MKMGAILVNTGCTMDCTFCSPKKPEEFSLLELHELEGELIRNVDHHVERGVDMIEISGADPASYDNIIYLVKYIKENGIDKILLSSHGTAFSHIKLLRLKEAGLTHIRFPIYGVTAASHGAISGHPESFHKLRRAIHDALRLGYKIAFTSLLTNSNKNSLIDLYYRMLENAIELSPMGIDAIVDISLSMPAINIHEEKPLDYYIPYRKIKGIMYDFHEDFLERVKFDRFKVRDIPYCLVGKDSPYIDNNETVDELVGETGTQLPEVDNRLEGNETVPNYRVRTHVDFCEGCPLKYKCSGFFAEDIRRFGIEQNNVFNFK